MIKLIKWLYNNNQQFEYTPVAFKMNEQDYGIKTQKGIIEIFEKEL